MSSLCPHPSGTLELVPISLVRTFIIAEEFGAWFVLYLLSYIMHLKILLVHVYL